MNKGKFVISLDFELLWGVYEESYKSNIEGVRRVIPELLRLFSEYEIHCTWATVGMLFAEDRGTLRRYMPINNPMYKDKKLRNFENLCNVGANEAEDIYHYGKSLIKLISDYPYQEVGTHTFSHYYCLEEGQDIRDFEEDIKAAVDIAKTMNIALGSLVFPRNQFNSSYLDVLKQNNISSYRGNPVNWMYKASSTEEDNKFKRIMRLIDSYINLTGYNGYKIEKSNEQEILNIRASRFLRPYSNSLKMFEKLKIWRIKLEMTHAAKNNEIYHLWWHPHNFGVNTQNNLDNLISILKHYQFLNQKYGFKSMNMNELGREVR